MFYSELINSYVKAPRFVERPWLASKIEIGLASPECRFLLLTAEPGSGKTAFMAWLAEQHPNWCRYFIRRDQRTPFRNVGVHFFLSQIGYQLATIYPELFNQESVSIHIEQEIGTANIGSQIVGASANKIYANPFYKISVNVHQRVSNNSGNIIGIELDELYSDVQYLPWEKLQFMALFDPVKLMSKQKSKCQIVVLIDALDELHYHNNQETLLNWLTNCEELPENLRFVITSRPDDKLLNAFRSSQERYICEITINANDTNVKQDLSTYTLSLLQIEAVQSALKTISQESNIFLDRIVEQANGNFGYLDAIGRAIDQAVVEHNEEYLIELLNLSSLPKTLEGLYLYFLIRVYDIVKNNQIGVKEPKTNTIRFLNMWTYVYRPILGVLAVAREPLTLKQIQNFVAIYGNWGDLIEAIGHLRQFLDQVGDCYRFYHSTLPEFLTSPETQKKTSSSFCYVDIVEQNQQIVNYYQKDVKIWDKGDPENNDIVRYGLLYLPIHLYDAGERDQLYTLLTESPKWMNIKSQHLGIAAYIDDLNFAINGKQKHGNKDFNEPLNNPDKLQTLIKLYTVKEVAYQQVSIPHIKTLVWQGHKVKALSNARLIPDAKKRFDALMTIYDALKEQNLLDPILLEEAEKLTHLIGDNKLYTAEALIKLATNLIESKDNNKAKLLLYKAVEVTEEIQDDYSKAKTLSKLVNALAICNEKFINIEKIETQAKQVIHRITNSSYRAEAMLDLAVVFAKIGHKTKSRILFEEVYSFLNKEKDILLQTDLLIKLALAQFDVGISDTISLFKQVNRIGSATLDYRKKADILINLVIALAKSKYIKEAKNTLKELVNCIDLIDGDKASIERKFAHALGYVGFYNDAKEIAIKIKDKKTKIELLCDLAILVNNTNKDEANLLLDYAQEVAETIEEVLERDNPLTKIVETLEDIKNFSKAEEVATALVNIERSWKESGYSRPKVLIKLATILAEANYEENVVNTVFAKAENAARSKRRDFNEDFNKVDNLSNLAVALIKSGREARQILCEIYEVIERILFPEKELDSNINQIISFDRRREYFEEQQILVKISQSLAQIRSFTKVKKIADAIQYDDLFKAQILISLVEGLAKEKDFFSSKEIVHEINENWAKAWAMSKLAVEVAKNNAKEAKDLFQQAKEITFLIKDNIKKEDIIIELVADLINVGDFIEVINIIKLVEENYVKSIATSKLARGYALAKDFNQANDLIQKSKVILSEIQVSFQHFKAKRELALGLAQINYFREALNILLEKKLSNEKTSNDFLLCLIDMQSSFEQLQPGLTVNILQSAIHIFACWEYSDWVEIDKCLSRK